ncbi:PHD and RING finger domain-containing protein 1 [Linum perenne]
MGRGGKVVGQRSFKKRVRSNEEGSDDSDEDYVIEDEEQGSGDESVEYASSVEGYCSSEDGFGGGVDEEEGERKKGVRRWNNHQRRSSLDKAKTGGRKRRKVSYEEDDDYVKVEDDDNGDDCVNVRANKRRSRNGCNGKLGGKSLRNKKMFSYEEDDDYVDVEDDDCDEEDDDKDDEDYLKVRASKRSKGRLGNGDRGLGKRRKDLYEEDEDEDYVNADVDVNVRFDKRRSKSCLENGKTLGKRRRDSCEEDEDEDYVNVDDGEEEEEDADDYEGEDEELALCEEEGKDDCLDEEEEEEEEFIAKKKSSRVKRGRMARTKRGAVRSKRTRKNSRVPKKSVAKKGRLRKKVRYGEEDDDDDDDLDFIDCNLPAREKSKKTSGSRGGRRGRRKNTVNSDSDFVASGSECEYTISEEEREQVREAKRLFGGGLKNSLRSSSSVDNQESSLLLLEDKPAVRKGKEKVKESKEPEEAKQVCGICFTEEDKRRLRGTLDCCSHYFCFKCIMEWSKVESRCPLCKQRFATITKNGRLVGVDLRSEVIEVPKRDQVYQPTEEEIRSYFDPYEDVICTECRQGGDDDLMLLCDLCDSPAHTYCVGHGRHVPDGNWYCEGCKHVALGSSSSQNQESTLSDQRPVTSNRFSRPMPTSNRFIRQTPVSDMFDRPPTTVSSFEDRLHPISESSTFPQAFGSPISPGFSMGVVQAAAAGSPTSGTGAQTLWSRREIQRRIQTLLSSRMNPMSNGVDGIQAAANVQRIQSLLSSRMNMMAASGVDGIQAATNVHRGFADAGITQNGGTQVRNSRTQDSGMLLGTTFIEGRSQNNNPSSLVDNSEFVGFRPNQWRPAHQESSTVAAAAAAIDRSVNLTLWPENSGINLVPGNGHIDQYNNRSSNRLGIDFPPYGINNNQLYILKEHLQSMVTNHLKALSRDIELGQETMNEIVKASTHTVMAHCGLEHESNQVHPLVPPPPSRCTHVDRIASGQDSIMRGFCSSCFESFVSDVVKNILDSRVPTRLPQWLSLAL